jgi:aminoglycoside phosphotransferase (APT) family kinase protein
MHAGEVGIDEVLVERLGVAQFPALTGLPVRAVRSTGTVNAIYRLEDDLCARLPRVPAWAQDLVRELEWLPKLAPQLSVRVPEPVARGRPTRHYPFPWAIYRWIGGQPYADGLIRDEGEAAEDLAWSVFGPAGRATFRGTLDVGDDTWERARGYALHQAALIIPYYAQTNARFVALARRTVEQILGDAA